MKIVVIGGSGLIGSKLVNKFRELGHEAVAASPNSGVNTLVRRGLSAHNDTREVIADAHARYFGAELNERTLVPGDDAHLASTRFEDWLSHSTAGK